MAAIADTLIAVVACFAGKPIEVAIDMWAKFQRTFSTQQVMMGLKKFQALQSKGAGSRIKFCKQVGTAPPQFVAFSKTPQRLSASDKRTLRNAIDHELDLAGIYFALDFRREK